METHIAAVVLAPWLIACGGRVGHGNQAMALDATSSSRATSPALGNGAAAGDGDDAGFDEASAPSAEGSTGLDATLVDVVLANDAEDSGEEGADAPGPNCAIDTKATPAPLDLYFMVDTSGSMDDLVTAGQSKWAAVVAAIDAFVNDPTSAGIGVGLQYFPLTKPGIPAGCSSSAQCGNAGPCVLSICTTDPSKVAGVVPCDTPSDCTNLPCLNGACQCSRIGACHNDHNSLCYLGNVCSDDPNGFALGSCDPLTTSNCVGGDSCAAGDYAAPAVPIAPLPAAASAVSSSLSAHQPSGSTPTAPALAGVVQGAATYAAAHPAHAVVAVLATDGIPDECSPSDIPSIAATAGAGLAGTPSVRTFVIGVFTPSDVDSGTTALDSIADAGGTGQVFTVGSTNTPSGSVEARFLAALESIRAAALPCRYVVPAPPDGGTPDFNALSARYTSGSGSKTDVAYVGTPSHCSPTAGGWYYDVDPATGAAPADLILCPATCSTLAGDTAGHLDVGFGCQTLQQ